MNSGWRLQLVRLRIWIVRLLAFTGLLLVTVTFTPVLGWWAKALAGPWHDPRGDVLIVLAAGIVDEGVLDAASQWRTLYGAAAWKNGFRSMVVSGRDAAPAMKKLMTLYGVPETAIAVENGSLSTRENAVFSAAILRGMPGRKVLLTSDYHMYRASRCFAKAGIPVEPRPFPDALKRMQRRVQRWPVFFDLLGESVKIVWYRWQGWI